MAKPLFDAAALIDLFQNATARQGEQLRKASAEATRRPPKRRWPRCRAAS